MRVVMTGCGQIDPDSLDAYLEEDGFKAIEKCVKAGINVIADGSCILVVLGYREH